MPVIPLLYVENLQTYNFANFAHYDTFILKMYITVNSANDKYSFMKRGKKNIVADSD